jgi:hypothetical protein
MLEALDRAVAFDRGVDRARLQSPSLFHPDVTTQKYLLDDGTCEHVFHHPTLGEVGRLRIEERAGRTRIDGRVAGDTDDPLHAQRDARFKAIMAAFARANDHRCVESKHMPCERCGTVAAAIIFIEEPERHAFEDCARLMFPEYSRLAAPVWIIGPPLGDGPEPERPADILKVWPEREPMQRLRPDEFNPICSRFVDEHCTRKAPRRGQAKDRAAAARSPRKKPA